MTNALDALDDPDIVGAAEYRAIHDCLSDAEAHDPEVAVGMLREFVDHATRMIDHLGSGGDAATARVGRGQAGGITADSDPAAVLPQVGGYVLLVRAHSTDWPAPSGPFASPEAAERQLAALGAAGEIGPEHEWAVVDLYPPQ